MNERKIITASNINPPIADRRSPVDKPSFQELVARSIAWFDSLSPEEQAAHREAQRQSWVRGEMTLDRTERKEVTVPPTADPVPAMPIYDFITTVQADTIASLRAHVSELEAQAAATREYRNLDKTELIRLRALNAELVEALKPFSEWATDMGSTDPGFAKLLHDDAHSATVDDLRRARAALAKARNHSSNP